MTQLTKEQLKQLLPKNPYIDQWYNALSQLLPEYEINTPQRIAAFIAQCAHESGGFTALKENLNYKAETLMKLWPKRFPTLEEANTYAHQPEKIANHIYSNRMGNRDEKSGDGWRFRGSGICQLTGHDNFYHAGKAIGVDLVANPDLARTPKYAAPIAGWFWQAHNCDKYANAKDYNGLTKIINGGLFGAEQRRNVMEDAEIVLCA